MMHINKAKIFSFVNLLSGLFTMVVLFAINFFLSPFIVENLGEEANGFVQLANNFITYASLITIALNSMAARFISVSYNSGDKKSANRYYSSLIAGNAAIILLLIVPSIYCVWKLEALVNIQNANLVDVKILFALVFASFFVTQMTSLLGVVPFVSNKIYITNLISVLRTIINALFLVIVFALLAPRVFYISAAALLANIVTLIFHFIVKQKLMPELSFRKSDVSTVCVKTLIGAGVWNTINQCGNILMTGMDLLLTNLLIGPLQMGILSVAKIVPTSIVQLCGIINNSFAPELTIAYAKESKTEFWKTLNYSMKISSILVSVVISTFAVYGKQFYTLWMPTMDATQLTILSILSCMMYIPLAGLQVLYNVYTVTNKLQFNSITFCISGVINIIAVVWFAVFTEYGVFAVASISAIISIIRNIVIMLPYAAKILHVKWNYFFKHVLVALSCAALSIVICGVIQHFYVSEGWLSLVFTAGISALICLVVTSWVVLSKEEKQKIVKLFSKEKRGNYGG